MYIVLIRWVYGKIVELLSPSYDLELHHAFERNRLLHVYHSIGKKRKRVKRERGRGRRESRLMLIHLLK